MAMIEVTIAQPEKTLSLDSQSPKSSQTNDSLVAVPYTFVLDALSPSLRFVGKINTVAVNGDFLQNEPDTLLGPDADSIWRKTIYLRPSVPVEYQFILDGSLSLNDPDNPLVSINDKSVAVPQVNPLPFFSDFSPKQGSLFEPPVSSLKIEATISPGDSGYAIDKNSLHLFVDGVEVDFTADSVGKGFRMQEIEYDVSLGRHIVAFAGADVKQHRARTAYLTFGVYPSRSGYHYVDAENDDDGPGGYTYPANTATGACDLRAIHIATNETKDSLLFTLEMAKITSYTRVAMGITNSIFGSAVDALHDVNLKIPEWNTRGIYLLLAVPDSPTRDGNENTLFISRDPLQRGDSVQLNSDARATGQFRFALSVASLERVLDTFNREWYLSAYTFLRDSRGIVSPDSICLDAPNVFDVAFTPDVGTQHRLLGNYRCASDFGGPRSAMIATSGRGICVIRPTDINAGLANRIPVKILANGGDLYTDHVTIYGSVGDSSITSARIRVVRANTVFDTSIFVTSGSFSHEIRLEEGENRINATVAKDDVVSHSNEVNYRRIVDHKLQISTSASVNGSVVTLTGDAVSPDSTTVSSFAWTPDPNNPAPTVLSRRSEREWIFVAPEIVGEYYFTFSATSSRDTNAARLVVLVDSVERQQTRPEVVDLATWHPRWVDTAIVYEIFPRTFSLAGTLKAITGRLSILRDLGVTCLLLMPIHPSGSSDGYRVTDYFSVNPDYGTKEDLKQLIEQAHMHGMKVIAELVFEHTHSMHPFMVDAYRYQHMSPYYDFYAWNPDASFQHLFNWIDAPSINLERVDARDYLMQAAKFWLREFNLDGFRCDLAGTINSLNPTGAAFWQRFRSELKAIRPDVFLVADADIVSDSSCFDRKFDAGYDLGALTTLKNVFNRVSSISSLDSAVVLSPQPKHLQYARALRLLESHRQSRFAAQYSFAQTKAAAALLLTLPGLPTLYAGQEVGERTTSSIIDWSDYCGLRDWYKKLIQIRVQDRALVDGDFERISNTAPDTVYSFLRTYQEKKVIVIHNLSDATVTIKINLDGSELGMQPNQYYYFSDILNNASYLVTDGSISQLPLTLKPYMSQILVISKTPVVGVRQDGPQSLRYALFQNYPNPFNPRTAIRYQIADASAVKLEIFNVLGQKIATIVDKVQPAGQYVVEWDGKNSMKQQVSSGVYLYKLSATGISPPAGQFSELKKMVLVR